MSLKAIMAAGAMLALMATPGLSQEKPKTHEFNMATGWSGGPLMDIGAKAFAEKVKELSTDVSRSKFTQPARLARA